MRHQNDGPTQARYFLKSQNVTHPCPSSGSPFSQVSVGRKLGDFLPFATALSRFTGTTGTPYLLKYKNGSLKLAHYLLLPPNRCHMSSQEVSRQIRHVEEK